MKINKNTIIRWLKSGSKLNWCYYNPKEEMQKSAKKNCVNKCKIIKVFKEDVFIYEFSSITELERQSFKILGIKITKYIISNILKKNIRYKGFSFKHVIYKKEVIN